MTEDANAGDCLDDLNDTNYRLWKGEGSIVVFAKCPIPGKSKTRLIPLLGEDGSVRLAKAMLSDVLNTISGCSKLNGVRKILMYAPGTPEGRERMETILTELGLSIKKANGEENTNNEKNKDDDDLDDWHLLPMLSNSSNDLRSNDLGAKLEDALVRVRKLQTKDEQRSGVVFLGMDAPMLPLEDIHSGLERATSHQVATLCPATDGGYTMLCVPHQAAPSWTFGHGCWSHPWTGMSQAKAITDQGIHLSIGKMVRDMDEPSDVEEFLVDLGLSTTESAPHQPMTTLTPEGASEHVTTKNLELPSGQPPWLLLDWKKMEVTSTHPPCHFTRKVLKSSFGYRNNNS